MSATAIIPLNHFDPKLKQELSLYGPSDVRLREHEMFSWIDEYTSGSWYCKVMITDAYAYLDRDIPWEKRLELEEAHFTFSNRSDAVRFKLTWG